MIDDMLFEAVLSVPPSTNHAYTKAKNHDRLVMTTAGKKWKARHFNHLALEARMQGWNHPSDAPLRIELTFYFQNDKRKRDLDDHLKLLLDIVADALGFNDFHFDDIRPRRGAPTTRPRVKIEIYPGSGLVPDDEYPAGGLDNGDVRQVPLL